MENEVIIFVKFGKKHHVKKLLDGKIHFSNAANFRGIEKVGGLRGQGDAFEAMMQLKNGKALITDTSTQTMVSVPNCSLDLTLDETLEIPVFCIAGIKSSDCYITKNGHKRTLKIKEKIATTIRAHFPKADTAGVFFEPNNFIKCVEQLGVVYYDYVQYFNFAPNQPVPDMITYRNAISCFNSKAYTGCALCLFAIIDSCFIIGQPKSDKKNRDLAKRASQRAFDEDGSAFFVVAHTVKIIIEKLFSGGKDFDLTIENGMNRNFISHGMNLYNPTRTDCLKLFVLLYNIYLMFDSELFRWGSETDR